MANSPYLSEKVGRMLGMIERGLFTHSDALRMLAPLVTADNYEVLLARLPPEIGSRLNTAIALDNQFARDNDGLLAIQSPCEFGSAPSDDSEQSRFNGFFDPGALWHNILASCICLPALYPGWAVRLIRPRGEGASLRCISTEPLRERFRQVLREQPDVTQPIAVPFPEDLAQRIQQVWSKVLLQVRNPRERSRGTDGVNYYFSGRVIDTREFISGYTWCPEPGTTAAHVTGIGYQLREFATADPDHRVQIEAKIKHAVDVFLGQNPTV